MKITVINTALSPALTHHAETRAWLATQRFQDQVSWLTIYLRRAGGDSAGVECRIDGWVSGVGQVISEYRCSNPAISVEIAAARFKHSVMRRLKSRWQTARRWRMRSQPANSGRPLLAEAGT
jgi:hypothetical protein